MASFPNGGTKAFLKSRHLQSEFTYPDAASVCEEVRRRRSNAEDDDDVFEFIAGWCGKIVSAAATVDVPWSMQSQDMAAVMERHLIAAQLAVEALGPSLRLLKEALDLLREAIDLFEAGTEPKDWFSCCMGQALAGLVERAQNQLLAGAKEGARPPVVPLCYRRIIEFLRQAVLPFSYPATALLLNPDAVNTDLEPFREVSDALLSLYNEVLFDVSGRAQAAHRKLRAWAESSGGSGSLDPNQESAGVLGPSNRPPFCVCCKFSENKDRRVRAPRLWRRRQNSAILKNGQHDMALHGPSPLRQFWTPDTDSSDNEKE